MTMYREILRLHFEGRLSQRDIAASCRCAHSTVKRVLARAAELRLDVSNTASMSDSALAKLLYPQAILPRIQKWIFRSKEPTPPMAAEHDSEGDGPTVMTAGPLPI